MAGNDDGPVEMLQEEVDEDYEPTDKEIREYAEWLGIDAEEDSDLLWIARRGLMTPLPKPWRPCQSGDGEIFYFNKESGENTWDHPCDDELRALYASEREKKAVKANKSGGEADEGSPIAATPSVSSAASTASAPPRPPPPPSTPPPKTGGGAAPASLSGQPQPLTAASSNEAGKKLAGLGSLGPLPPLAPPRAVQPVAATDGAAPPLNKRLQPATDLDDLFDMPLELGAPGADSAGPANMEAAAGTGDPSPKSRVPPATPPLSPITATGGEFPSPGFGSPITARDESPSPVRASAGDAVEDLSPIATTSSSSSAPPVLPSPAASPVNVPPAPPSLQASPLVPPLMPPLPPQARGGPPVHDETSGVTARLCRELEQLRSEVASQAVAHKATQAKEQAANVASLSALSRELASEAAESRRLLAERASKDASLESLRNESAAQLASQGQVAFDLQAELRAVRAELSEAKVEASASAALAASATRKATEAQQARERSSTLPLPSSQPREDNILASDALSPPTPELASILAAELRSSRLSSKSSASEEASPPVAIAAPVHSERPGSVSPSIGWQEQPSLWSQLEEDRTSAGPTPSEKAVGISHAADAAAAASSSLDISSLSAVFLEPSPQALFDRQGHSPLGERGRGPLGSASICVAQKPQRNHCVTEEQSTWQPGTKAATALKGKWFPPEREHDTCTVEEIRSLRAELGELREELLKERASGAQAGGQESKQPLHSVADQRGYLAAGGVDSLASTMDPASRCPTLRLQGNWSETPSARYDQLSAPLRGTLPTPTGFAPAQGVAEEVTGHARIVANEGAAAGVAGQTEQLRLQLQLQALAAARCVQGASVPSPHLEFTMEAAPEPWGVGGHNDSAKSRLTQAAEERSLRAQRDSRDTRHRLENAEAELERVSWELKQWREDADDNDRLLRDTRSSLHKEQASSVAAKALVRESQREVQRLAAQLKSQENEGELAAAEVQRVRSEVADHEAEKQRLQLQLQAREAELGQLRHRQKAHTQLSDADLRTQRLSLVEREETLGGRERFLEEREKLAGEAEAKLRQDRHQLRTELQRAELAGLRATVNELSVPLAAQRSSSMPGGERSRGRRSGSVGVAVARGDAPWPICSSDDSFVPKEFVRRLDGKKILEAPTPSSSSATSPDFTSKALATAIGEQCDPDAGGKANTASIKPSIACVATSSAHTLESLSAARAAAAAAAGELPEFLRNWRKELRHEHSALEEDRRLWRAETRRIKRRGDVGYTAGDVGTRGGAGVDVLAEVRTALDARAAVLNNAIGEYRALEKLHSSGSHRRQHSSPAGTTRGAGGARRRASSSSALGKGTAQFRDVVGSGCGQSMPVKGGAEEEDILHRWQHILLPPPQAAPGSYSSGLRSTSCTTPPLSGRTGLMSWQPTGLHSSAALRAGVGGG